MRLATKAGFAILMAAALAPATAQAVTFDFEANTQFTTTPFTDTVGGLSATFTGEASVCGAIPQIPPPLTGNVLIQNLCVTGQSGPLGVSLSSDLSSASFDFATVVGAASLTVGAFENANLVSTSTFTSSVPSGFSVGEGLASVTGTFNRLVLTSASGLAIDNLNATPQVAGVPEPASMSLLGAGLCALILARRRGRKALL
jgi:hypothetical protein